MAVVFSRHEKYDAMVVGRFVIFISPMIDGNAWVCRTTDKIQSQSAQTAFFLNLSRPLSLLLLV
jgi:hypothetical protein